MNRELSHFEPHARLLGALANPIRLGVLATLRTGPAIVGDLAERFSVEQTKLSKHLGILRKSGLVTCSVDGRCRVYALADKDVVDRILSCMHQFNPLE